MTHASAVPLPEAVNDECLDTNAVHRQPEPETLSKTDFYVRTLQLYKILRKILSEVYEPWEDGNAADQPERTKPENIQAQALLELDEELSVFESSLPAALQWRSTLEPEGLAEQFRRESSLLRGRFLHLRILLLRPTLVKFCRDNRPPRQPDVSSTGVVPKRKIISDFSLSCSTSCVEAAIELSHLMNDISRTELASVWWYSLFYTFTAGVVLVLAQTCPAMGSIFPNNMDSYSNTAKNCANSLQKTLTHLLDEGGRGLRPTNKTTGQVTAQSTSPRMGHDAPLPGMPTFFPTPTGTETNVGTNQGPLGVFAPEPFGSVWNGQDLDGSLVEMLWDDLWLTSPSFF
ncbi:hypothetical protein ASPCADRAFT_502917 [Aspergillus carbonarius ITEM 5010]|uniref:Transcription factor domain-containing protein n=1 Tax=Aspergillus carbonarius (strain ITEM 5010) TaxID=602072 RepID=A0A1R3S1J7_ASPC5|nr:hypothetical protein ASPCADRAFT_502917 [Aspergillus carbonarius ITEM 5010]